MDICSALDELRATNMRIERIRDDILRLRAQMTRCTSVLTGMPRGGGASGFADIQARIDEKERMLASELSAAMELTATVEAAPEMDRLTLSERDVIRMAYIYGLNRTQQARQLQYDRCYVYRLEKSAREKLAGNRKPCKKHHRK